MRWVKILKTIVDEKRLRILNLLNRKEICNCELTEILNISQPAVSKHIRKLKKAMIIKEKQNGWWSYYSLNLENKDLNKIISYILRLIEKEEKLKKDLKKLNNNICVLKRGTDERYKNRC